MLYYNISITALCIRRQVTVPHRIIFAGQMRDISRWKTGIYRFSGIFAVRWLLCALIGLHGSPWSQVAGGSCNARCMQRAK